MVQSPSASETHGADDYRVRINSLRYGGTQSRSCLWSSTTKAARSSVLRSRSALASRCVTASGAAVHSWRGGSSRPNSVSSSRNASTEPTRLTSAANSASRQASTALLIVRQSQPNSAATSDTPRASRQVFWVPLLGGGSSTSRGSRATIEPTSNEASHEP